RIRTPPTPPLHQCLGNPEDEAVAVLMPGQTANNLALRVKRKLGPAGFPVVPDDAGYGAEDDHRADGDEPGQDAQDGADRPVGVAVGGDRGREVELPEDPEAAIEPTGADRGRQ